MNINVDRTVCTRCGICIKYCSFEAIEYRDGIPEFNANCVLCGACVKPCPVNCITGSKKKLHVMDQSKCTKCGACRTVCKFDAVDAV